MKVLTRRIEATDIGGGFLLRALGCDTASGRQLRLFFQAGFDAATMAPIEGFDQIDVRSIGGGILVVGHIDSAADAIPISVAGKDFHVPLVAAEKSLFAGLNAAIAIRNGETAQSVAQWIQFHVDNHGLQGALIVDRAGPEVDHKFAAALKNTEIAGLKQLVILSSSVALGNPTLGPEAHAFNAPDAPGKDRMTPPDPAPWSAPFAENIIFELLRHSYMDDARAVMNIDTFDLLCLAKAPNVFDRALNAKGGVITLIGDRIYPWSIRKGATPVLGDHVCRRFDGGSGNPRWCIAPATTGADTIWRWVRIVGTDAAPDEIARYERCMAVRHPTDKISRIVPKASLIEDPALMERARMIFGHKPVRVPLEKQTRRVTKNSNRTTIVTTMKNEGPFILEWLAYHRAIGVQDFLIYTNDCTDGTDTMLKLLDKHGIVQHRENPFRQTDLKPQHAALQAAEKEPIIKSADWVVCMDVDEFMNIHAGKGNLSDLYKAAGDANMISMTWRLFGNSDIHDFSDKPIIQQFTRCAPHMARKPHNAWGFKTLFRHVGIFKKFGVHRPKGLKPQLLDDVKWVNGSGKPLPKTMFRNAWRSTADTVGYDLVTLNHYAVRSVESFLVKRDRGRVNHVDRDQGLTYWFRMNNNFETDTSIHRMIPAMNAELDELAQLDGVAAAHVHSVAQHRAKIDELRATPNYAAFFQELTGNRLQILSRLHQHFGSAVFLSGPQVIPDEYTRADLPKNEFFTVPHPLPASE